MKKKLVCVLTVFCTCMLCACGKKEAETQIFKFEETAINASGKSAEDFLKELTEISEMESSKVVSDKEVEIQVTEEQKKALYSGYENFIRKAIDKFSDEERGYLADVSDDHTEMNFYYDMNFDKLAYSECFMKLVHYNSACQILDGKTELHHLLSIYNSETGKLIDSENLEDESLKLTESKWKESYKLSESEINNLSVDEGVQDIALDLNFTDGFSTIITFRKASDVKIEYLYFDEDECVHMGVTKEQKKVLSKDFEEDIQETIQEFSKLGKGYEIEINDDYTEVDFKFDKNLPVEDQELYVVYVQTSCIIKQVVEDKKDYYVLMNIEDSLTGDHVATGDSVNGITWNMEKVILNEG